MAVACVVSLGAGCGGSTGESTDSRVDCSTAQFDPAAWAGLKDPYEADKPTVRQKLADVLVECDVLAEKSIREVRALLGEPDSRDRQGWRWTLGPAGYSDLGSEMDYLVVTFDRENHVSSVLSSAS